MFDFTDQISEIKPTKNDTILLSFTRIFWLFVGKSYYNEANYRTFK